MQDVSFEKVIPNSRRDTLPVKVVAPCFHTFVFLRQETRLSEKPSATNRFPVWITNDVFYCSLCLEYRYLPINNDYRESIYYNDPQTK